MSSSTSTIVSVVLTFILTTALNTFLNYLNSDKGTINISNPTTINNKQIVIVTLENHTTEFINGVTLEIPKSISTTDITSDSALKATEPKQSTNSDLQLITIDKLQPRRTTRIFIPTPPNSILPPIRITNPEAAGVEIRDEKKLDSPLKESFLTGVISAFLYAAILTIYSILSSRREKILRKHISQLNKNIDRKQNDINKVKETMEHVEVRLSKQRLLLQARLYDYSKELNFWRGTIAKLLTSKGESLKNANEVYKEVTRSLKTFGTMKDPEDYEATRIAAAWIAEAESNDHYKRNTISNRKKNNLG